MLESPKGHFWHPIWMFATFWILEPSGDFLPFLPLHAFLDIGGELTFQCCLLRSVTSVNKIIFFPWTLSHLGIFFFLFYSFTKINIKFMYILNKPGKTADIWRRYHWFPRQKTSEKRAQKFHTDDASLPRSGYFFWLVESNFPCSTTNQKHCPDQGSDASSVCNFCACFSDVIWRGNQWQRRQMLAVFSS